MNANNLIRLGTILQKKWNMLDDFKIYEVQPDNPTSAHVTIPLDRWGYPTMSFDEVELVQLSLPFQNKYESIWAGYSRQANVLVIQR
jgi:hypothetical protein